MAKRSKKRTPKRKSVVTILAARLHSWRSRQGVPLKHVAHDLNVSISVISQWERGLRFPSARNIDAIAAYLDIPVCCLMYDGEGPCPHHGG
jgi:transcriptional regulator with XRE-family HTH domain